MRAAIAGILVCVATLLAPGAPRAQVKDGGPTTIVVTYRSTPEKRAAFRAFMQDTGVRDLERLKKEGVFEDYQVLFTSFTAETVGRFDMALVLQFASFVDAARWKEVDRRAPGGLSAAGLALAVPEATVLAYPVGRGEALSRDPGKAAHVLGL